MKKTFLLLFLLSFALVLEVFAIGAFDVNVGVLSSSGTPEYMVGVTIKSIGTLGLELNIEGNLGNTFDIGKIGNVNLRYFNVAIWRCRPFNALLQSWSGRLLEILFAFW